MQRVDRKSMFDQESLLAMCDVEKQMTYSKGYASRCEKNAYLSAEPCCRIWSATNYVTLLTNLPSCYDIKSKHIDEAKGLLTRCLPYYVNGSLVGNCQPANSLQSICPDVPGECTRNNAVFEMLYYASDSGLFSEDVSGIYFYYHINHSNGNGHFSPIMQGDIFLSEIMVILPVARSTQTMDLYNSILHM